MIHTDEDDEFDRIERESKMKGQPYHSEADAIKEALAQPEQKPVGLVESLKDAKPCCGEYETCWRACTPRGKFLGQRDAQRTWVGLTDEELSELSASGLALWGLWRAIEAKLKEKNT